MSSAVAHQGLYVELDTLLDTRLGTIARLGQELAIHVLSSGYHERETDLFAGVAQQSFRELYSQRDQLTLAHSACTPVVQLLRQLTAVATEQALLRPFHSGPKIYINLHPYQMTDEEQHEIRSAVITWLKDPTTEVEFVSLSPEQLTPEWCRATHLAAMFLYDYESWMEAQTRAFETTRLADVTVFGPRLFRQQPTEEEYAQLLREVGDPFSAFEVSASPLVGLQLIPVREFSTIVSTPTA